MFDDNEFPDVESDSDDSVTYDVQGAKPRGKKAAAKMDDFDDDSRAVRQKSQVRI
jgi:hypothetical protein